MDSRNRIGVINYTITLFWTEENKVLFRKQIEGNAPVLNHKSLAQISSQSSQDTFHEAAVHCDNYLNVCLQVAFDSQQRSYSWRSQQDKKNSYFTQQNV